MIQILKKFFNFCPKVFKDKFYKSIVVNAIQTIGDAMKFPAMYILIRAVVENRVTVETILLSLGILVGGLILSMLCRYSCTMLQTEGGYGACAAKRVEIGKHLRYLPMGYFNSTSLGYITSVTTNDLESMSDVATRAVMMVCMGLFNTAIVVIAMLCFAWQIGLICIGGVMLFALVNHFMQRKAKTILSEKVIKDTTLVGNIVEYIQGMGEIKSYSLEASQNERIQQSINESAKISIKAELGFIPYDSLQKVVTKGLNVVIIIASLLLYFAGTIDLASSIVCIIASFVLFAALESAGQFSYLLTAIDKTIDKVNGIMSVKQMKTTGNNIIPKTHNIKIKDVEFSYDRKKIINGISLDIKDKTTTAIVGPSGSGKTTLTSLISRFWDVDKGEITLDGVNIKDYSIDSLMTNFSFVFQNVYLFNDTVKNNIAFGNDKATMEDIVEASKKACCYDFIMSLPNQFDTLIGEGGASLSGGEKQRISIARALLKDAPIVILDEATANVDPENEESLVKAIEALTKEKTIIMIAHRLKTVRNADQIVVIDNGQIVQKGTHNELIKEDGIYKTFVNGRRKAVSWKI